MQISIIRLLTLSFVEKTPYGRFWMGKSQSALTSMNDMVSVFGSLKVNNQYGCQYLFILSVNAELYVIYIYIYTALVTCLVSL